MKTIAIFSGYVLPHLGGVERYTDNLTREFINKGYKVIVVTSNYLNEKDYVKKNENYTLYKLPVYNIFKNRYPILKNNKIAKRIIEELSNSKIDSIIVNTRFYLTSQFGAKFGKKKGIPKSSSSNSEDAAPKTHQMEATGQRILQG